LGEKQLLEGTAATGEVEHIVGIGQVSRDEKKDLVGEVSEHCEASLDAEIDESGIAMLRGVFSFQNEEDGERKMGNTGKGRQEVNHQLPQATDITTATLHVVKGIRMVQNIRVVP
jgi:hypothetical protein